MKKWIGYSLLFLLILVGSGMLFINLVLEDLLKAKLESFIQVQEDRIYDYEYEKITVDFLSGNVELHNLKIIPRKKIIDSLKAEGIVKKDVYQIELDHFRLVGLDSWTLLLNNEIRIGGIVFEAPMVRVFSDKTIQITPSNELAQDIIVPTLNLALIDSLVLRNATFKISNVAGDTTTSIAFDTTYFAVHNIRIDSTLIAEGSYVEFEWTEFEMNNFRVKSMKDYKLFIKKLYKKKDKRVVYSEGIEFTPWLDKYAYMTHRKYQTDWFNIKVQKLVLFNLDFPQFQKTGKVHIDKIQIEGPIVELYRDKRMPVPPKKFKALPSKLFRDMKLNIHLDALDVNEGSVQYMEWVEGGTQPGTVKFDQINVDASNISSDPVKLSNNDTMIIEASGRFMNAGVVKFKYTAPILDSSDLFIIQGSVKDMPFNVTNPITENMAFIKFHEGHLNYVEFEMTADNVRSYGSLDISYTGLKKLEVVRNAEELKKKQGKDNGKDAKHKKKLFSMVANTLIPSDYGPDSKDYYPGKIQFERDQNKFIFGYLIKSVMQGVLTSMMPSKQEGYREMKREKKEERKKEKKEARKKENKKENKKEHKKQRKSNKRK